MSNMGMLNAQCAWMCACVNDYRWSANVACFVCGIFFLFVFSILRIDVWVFWLFLAVVIGVSALPVLARIIAEYKLFSSPLGVFTMNATTGKRIKLNIFYFYYF